MDAPRETADPELVVLAAPGNAGDGQGAASRIPTEELILISVRGMALFPGVVLPIHVGRPRSVEAVQAAVQKHQPVGVLLQRDPEDETPEADGLFRVGTVADIVRYITAPDGSHHLIAQGIRRFRVLEFLESPAYMTARVELFPEPSPAEAESSEVQAMLMALKERAHQALQLLPQMPEDLDQAIQEASSPAVLTDMVATFMDLPPDEKQEILEIVDLRGRMQRVLEKLAHQVELLSISRDIRQQTKGTLEKSQRDYYLREQLRTIQKELGEDTGVDLEDLERKISAAGMTPEAEQEARRELKRLERISEASAEYGLVRGYLEWMVELPWSVSTTDAIDIERARSVLAEDHYGLEPVKRRILEFLAVRKLNPTGKSPILCLVGPPGVGKTSLGQSIARSIGRKFQRLSLGGLHDESEIRGHRRTYVGAMPGNILQSLRKAGANNPVFMLDELDKLGVGFHGDPSAALLEVLDPEQNRGFRDNYLNVPFDLSRVMFIATANVLADIPGPLRDRCEVLEISGYTEEEKLEIGRRYLVRRQLENAGLTSRQCSIGLPALREIVRSYTREAGVRNFEREIGALCRHVAVGVAAGKLRSARLGPADVRRILGAPRFENEIAQRTSVPGVATGLAWTPVGGELLFIEATAMPGNGGLLLTGQLGDVMRESAMAALTLIKAHASELGLAEDLFSRRDIHIHVPSGAIPKDGPSAGVAMYTALVSLLQGRRVDSRVAMTGEISLRGLVLPVGGLKEKLLAAYNAGIRTVLLPARNAKDLEEVPANARDKLRFVMLERVEEALENALEKPAVRRQRARRKAGRARKKKRAGRAA